MENKRVSYFDYIKYRFKHFYGVFLEEFLIGFSFGIGAIVAFKLFF